MIDGLSLIPIAHAVQISTTLPGQYATSSGIGGYVANAYSFSLLIGGILAFGVIVYGGIRYMTSVGNPSGQSDAKEWIEGALLGLLLLVGAYFILKTINPQILNLTLPNTGTVSVTGSNTGGTTGGGTTGSTSPVGRNSNVDSNAAQDLANAGITLKPGASVAGARDSIINSLTTLKSECGCSVTVTAGTDGAHQPGEYSHAEGYKADLRLDSGLSNYITSNFASIGTRSDGAAMYQDNSTGAIYAREGSHWDVVSKP